MIETENKIRQKDLEDLVQNNIFNSFDNKTVMVTGASGLIGSEIVLSLLCANRLKKLNIKVIALVRNLKKADDIFSLVLKNPNFKLVVQDINESINYNQKVDYVIHTASVTASKDMIEKPVETILTTVRGTKNVLEFAKEHNSKICFISSIEVYGTIISEASIAENELGQIDLFNPRSSYPESKRMAENLCVSYCSEYNLDVKIARLTQTFGAGMKYTDNRVFAQFAKAALNKEDIILHTDGSSLKNYCYLTDAISGIFTILVKGQAGEAYNVANYDTAISIKDMANLVAKKYGINVQCQLDNQNRGYAEKYRIKMNSDKLEKLDWQPKIDLDEMFDRLINSLKEAKNEC